MKRQSLFDRYEIFVAAAVLGAHANTLARGFRQLDIRILLEVFTNWFDFTEEDTSLPFQNTQISRYLEKLIEEGFVRRIPGEHYPQYRLSRAGFIELLSRLGSEVDFVRREHFFFVVFFIDTYSSRIVHLVRREGKRFPYSLQVELQTLLDVDALVDRQILHVKRLIKRIEKRTQEQMSSNRLARALLQQGKTEDEIIEAVDNEFPFSLDTQRRYSEIFALGTKKQALYELAVGNQRRTSFIWEPSQRIMECYLTELEALKTALREAKSSDPLL